MIEFVNRQHEERVFSDAVIGDQNELMNPVLESVNLNFDSPLLGKGSLVEEDTLEDGITKIESRMREQCLLYVGTNDLVISECRSILSEIKSDRTQESAFSHIICMFLCFYGCWREAEYIARRWNHSQDIYAYILETLDSIDRISGGLSLCFPENRQVQAAQNNTKGNPTFKENVFFSLIDSFNIRMQCISKVVYSWLISNEKLIALEQLIENGRMSGSNRSKIERRRRKQEQDMLEYLHEELVVKNGNHASGEIQLLINLNENDLHLLSMEYAQYLNVKNSCVFRNLLNKQLFNRAVERQNIPLLSVFLKVNRKGAQRLFLTKSIMCTVQEFLSVPATFSVGMFFLKQMVQRHKNKQHMPEYLKTILTVMQKPEISDEFAMEMFAHTLHPIVLCLLASKLLLKLSQTINPFSSEMLKLAKFYLNRAVVYRDTIYDAREMSIVLFKPLFPSDKPMIKALRSSKYSEFFVEFLSHPCITFLLEQKWMSSYGWNPLLLVAFTPLSHVLGQAKIKDKKSNPKSLDATGQLSTYSSPNNTTGATSTIANTTVSSSLSSSGGSSRRQEWNIFRVIQTSTLEKLGTSNYIYQFTIFMKSVAVRTIFEFVVFLGIFMLTVYYLFRYIQNQNDYVVISDDVKQLMFNQKVPDQFIQGIMEAYAKADPSKYQQQDLDMNSMEADKFCDIILNVMSYGYTPFIDHFRQGCINIVTAGQLYEELLRKSTTVCAVILTLGLNVVLKQIYAFMLSGKISLSVLDIYDLIITVTSWAYLQVKILFLDDQIVSFSLEHFDYYTSVLKAIACILVFLLWIRLMLFLIRSQKIGIIVRVIILFIYDLSQFSVVLFLVLLTFAMLCYILFKKELEIYASFQKSFFTLVAAMYGAFDFQNQTSFQSLILIIFLFLVNIVMFNLLVAILNTRYEKTIKRSSMDYSLVVYDDYLKMRFSPFYSCLISLPPPFNLINILFGAIAIIFKSKKWNSFALKFSYIVFILIPISALFLGLSIAFIPSGFFIILRRLMIFTGQDNMVNGRKKSVFYRGSITLFRLISWVIFGIPFLLFTLITNDIPLFFKSAFVNKDNRYNFTKNTVLDIRVIQYASINNIYLHSARSEILNYLNFRESLAPKKQERLKKTQNIESAINLKSQPGNETATKIGLTTNAIGKSKAESQTEKDLGLALKKFGDGGQRQESINLTHLLKSIKFSVIYFNKSKCNSSNISRLLYIAKKKEQFALLLRSHDKNFFLNRSFSQASTNSNEQKK